MKSTQFIMSQQDRDRLVGVSVTLDGRPATVTGRLEDFPQVRDFNGNSREYCWHTVRNIVDNKGGIF